MSTHEGIHPAVRNGSHRVTLQPSFFGTAESVFVERYMPGEAWGLWYAEVRRAPSFRRGEVEERVEIGHGIPGGTATDGTFVYDDVEYEVRSAVPLQAWPAVGFDVLAGLIGADAAREAAPLVLAAG